jgi:transcriptional regulator with XRE-family HTH domain
MVDTRGPIASLTCHRRAAAAGESYARASYDQTTNLGADTVGPHHGAGGRALRQSHGGVKPASSDRSARPAAWDGWSRSVDRRSSHHTGWLVQRRRSERRRERAGAACSPKQQSPVRHRTLPERIGASRLKPRIVQYRVGRRASCPGSSTPATGRVPTVSPPPAATAGGPESLRTVSGRAGVSSSYLKELESGKSVPSQQLAQKIGDAIGIDLARLVSAALAQEHELRQRAKKREAGRRAPLRLPSQLTPRQRERIESAAAHLLRDEDLLDAVEVLITLSRESQRAMRQIADILLGATGSGMPVQTRAVSTTEPT